MPYPKNAELHSWWQESQRDFADTTWRRTSALKIGLSAAQRILATRQRVVKNFVLLKSNALFNAFSPPLVVGYFVAFSPPLVVGYFVAFLREEGGTRMRDGRSLRDPHFFACFITTAFPKLRALPQSPTATAPSRREPFTKHILPLSLVYFSSPAIASPQPRKA